MVEAPSPSPEPTEAEQAAAPEPAEAPPKLLLEPASSGRAGCRACGEKIAKGELRLGEKLLNPYTETDTTYWFHVPCAAYRRPESILKAIAETQTAGGSDPLSPELRAIAEKGVAHYRLARISRVELAPSGRARCRHCKEAIASESLRFALTIFQEGRFDPMGFVHAGCAAAYFGTPVELERALHFGQQLTDSEREQVRATFA